MSSSGSLDLRRELPLHYWALPQSLDITGSITLTEGAVAFGVHADIIRASAHGYSCCVKIPRFVGDYSDQAAFREFQLVRDFYSQCYYFLFWLYFIAFNHC